MHIASPVAAAALQAASTSSGKGSPIGTFVLLGLILVAGYLFFLRPARRRQQAALDQRGKAEVGDEVVTTAGLIATVVAMEDDEVILEVAPGVHSRYLPQAIVKLYEPPTDEEAVPGDDLIESDAGDEDTDLAGADDDEPSVEPAAAPEDATGPTHGGGADDSRDESVTDRPTSPPPGPSSQPPSG